jgi:hypothetical protein
MRAAIIVATTLALGLAGCASSNGQAPAGSAARDSGYPSLREVPRTTIANTNAEHWSAVEADLKAAGEELWASPRAQPSTEAEDPAAFLDAARQELDEARQSHEPN